MIIFNYLNKVKEHSTAQKMEKGGDQEGLPPGRVSGGAIKSLSRFERTIFVPTFLGGGGGKKNFTPLIVV